MAAPDAGQLGGRGRRAFTRVTGRAARSAYAGGMQQTTQPLYWWEDFPVGCERPYGPKLVMREEVLEFARQFDPQPFHLDEAAAEASLFGRLAASGWHTASMTMRMACDAYLLRTASLGSPGVEDLRWHKPVYPGDTLSGRMLITEARPMNSKPHLGLARSRWETVNQHGELVMTLSGWNMLRRRPGGAPSTG
jgi:acyl dehydratase